MEKTKLTRVNVLEDVLTTSKTNNCSLRAFTHIKVTSIVGEQIDYSCYDMIGDNWTYITSGQLVADTFADTPAVDSWYITNEIDYLWHLCDNEHNT